MLKKVQTDKAPSAFAHYSQAVVFDDRLVFCAAQVGIRPGEYQLVSEDVLAQAKQIFANIQAILEAANSSLANVIKVEIFLTNMNYFAAVNELYASVFKYDIQPARQTIEVSKLPRGASMSMSCIAYVNQEQVVNSTERRSEY